MAKDTTTINIDRSLKERIDKLVPDGMSKAQFYNGFIERALAGPAAKLFIVGREGPRRDWAPGKAIIMLARSQEEANDTLKEVPEIYRNSVHEVTDTSPGVIGLMQLPKIND